MGGKQQVKREGPFRGGMMAVQHELRFSISSAWEVQNKHTQTSKSRQLARNSSG